MNTQTRLWCLLALLIPTLPAMAGSVQLTPVSIKLTSTARIAVLTVRNTGVEDTVMQVSLNKWQMHEGVNALSASQDLVITPATFRLAPGAKQLIRISTKTRTSITEETAYRLLVEEVPKPSSAAYPQMQLVVRHDLPVFVMPDKIKAVLDMTLDCKLNTPRLTITNIGNIHSQVRQISINNGTTKQVIGKWTSADYLLVGAHQSWNVKQQVNDGNLNLQQKNYAITALTDIGSFTANVDNTCL